MYDAEGRPYSFSCTPNGSGSYMYDANGRRVEMLLPTGSGGVATTVYVYDAMGNRAQECTNTTSSPPCTTCYYLNDWLGSLRAVAGSSGSVVASHDYLPFGEELTNRSFLGYNSQDGLVDRFTGKERDQETGNDYFGARYYAGPMGRFLSPDWAANVMPIPYAVLDDPQSLNLYTYVRNGPLSRTDPDGHFDAKEPNARWSRML